MPKSKPDPAAALKFWIARYKADDDKVSTSITAEEQRKARELRLGSSLMLVSAAEGAVAALEAKDEELRQVRLAWKEAKGQIAKKDEALRDCVKWWDSVPDGASIENIDVAEEMVNAARAALEVQ